MATYHTRLLIIGSGSAGCTAAIYGARAMLKPIMVRGTQPGGQLTITHDVENYPGFETAVQGPWLMEQMEKQAAHVGATLVSDTIVDVDLDATPFMATGDSGDSYTADSVIIATGATARWLGIPSEKEFMGYGISACATCDGFFFKDQQVVVIGGGNSAVEEALYLSNIASKVTLIHRRDKLRAEKIAQERLFRHPKISVIWDAVIDAFVGTQNPPGLTHVRCRNVVTGALSDVSATGAFIAIGHVPNTDLVRGQVDVDAEGYIQTVLGSTRTSIPGVFAAGDVQDKTFRQAITAAGTGCMAALEAERWLSQNGKL